MRENYDIEPFEIETISLERIFIDKVFAAQFYFERRDYANVAKHVYDLTILLDNEKIAMFLNDSRYVLKVIRCERKEELNRKGGIAEDMKISNFDYFKRLSGSKEFEATFEEMQRIYVLNKKDKLTMESVNSAISKLQKIMSNFR